jgi:hypothetical protein
VSDQSYTILEFCAAERLSRAMFYKLRAQGKSPRVFYIGNSPRISHQARVEWRERLEAETSGSSHTAEDESAAMISEN